MADNSKYVQAQYFTLAGAGPILGDTTVTLTSMLQIDGVTELTMTDFGSKGFATIEPGSGTREEQISFTGITQNANGTATLTGVSNVSFVSPYTETSGLSKSHPGGVFLIITNTSGFYNRFTAINNDETITGLWNFPNNGNTPTLGTVYAAPTTDLQVASKKYIDDIAISGAPNATTSVKGIIQLATQAQVDAKTATGSTGASLAATPALARSTLLSDYVVDTGAANAYAIAPSPAISAYTTGQIFTFKAVNANTTTSTLNVNGLGTKTIKKNGGADNLIANDIIASQIVMVEYDGTNMQMIAPTAEVKIGQKGTEIYAADSVGTDTYAITLVPAPSAYVAGFAVNFKAGTANTGPSTLNVNGLGAIAIKTMGGQSDTLTGDILSGQVVSVVYDGTNFQMQSQGGLPNAYVFGNTTNFSGTTLGTNDLTIATTFTPRLIKLFYFIQGHNSSGSTNIYLGMKGIATFNGTSLVGNYITWGLDDGTGSQLTGTGGNPTAVAALIATANSTNAVQVGSAGGNAAEIRMTLSIASVSSTSFVIRRETTGNAAGSTAIAQVMYEAWA